MGACIVWSISKARYKIKLNHRKLLDGMPKSCGIPPKKWRTAGNSIIELENSEVDVRIRNNGTYKRTRRLFPGYRVMRSCRDG
ncbi:hypothetical protein C5167_001972 [Papaver somniferum]|uniref:Uncharacterized protein n=1 Tax=Papaver somniferum TaxID=3469 RepID=A0A4Y7KVV8_PAPSO|nr:hypothetical protein C5167_001972 [Papaver somniferum]